LLDFTPDPSSPLNNAQQLLMAITTNRRGVVRGYKAPHANPGTPPRRRFTRAQRFMIDAGDAEEGRPALIRRPRLFKGHRS